MQLIKYCMLFIVFIFCTSIGVITSKKYIYRLEELKELKTALNMFKYKIKFTYEPIPEIFEQISKNTKNNVSQIFLLAKNLMMNQSAGQAWEESIELSNNYLNKEDKQVLKTLSKLLGITDLEGQISQIEITQEFLGKQIQEAEFQRTKNEKLYKKLGITIGLSIVIILL